VLSKPGIGVSHASRELNERCECGARIVATPAPAGNPLTA
jgi:hypothetical protein